MISEQIPVLVPFLFKHRTHRPPEFEYRRMLMVPSVQPQPHTIDE